MSDTLTLVVLYDDLTTERFSVTTRAHARDFIRSEGDTVWDWYIEEDQKNDE